MCFYGSGHKRRGGSDIPKCTICNKSNLFADVDVYTVKEDLDQYREVPTGSKHHRICRTCLDTIEKQHNIILHVEYEYINKTNIVDQYKKLINTGGHGEIINKPLKQARMRRIGTGIRNKNRVVREQ